MSELERMSEKGRLETKKGVKNNGEGIINRRMRKSRRGRVYDV